MDEPAQMPTSDGRLKCPIPGFQKLASGKHKFRILWALRNTALGYMAI